jgi:hypothetical protein
VKEKETNKQWGTIRNAAMKSGVHGETKNLGQLLSITV